MPLEAPGAGTPAAGRLGSQHVPSPYRTVLPPHHTATPEKVKPSVREYQGLRRRRWMSTLLLGPMSKKRAAKVRRKSVLRKPILLEPQKGFWWWLVLEGVKVALAAAARHWIGWRVATEGQRKLRGGVERLRPLFFSGLRPSLQRAQIQRKAG